MRAFVKTVNLLRQDRRSLRFQSAMGGDAERLKEALASDYEPGFVAPIL